MALFVATVVGISETVLYIIWQSRRSHVKKARTRVSTKVEAIHEKIEDGYSSIPDDANGFDSGAGNVTETPDNAIAGQIRRRAVRHNEE